MADEAKQDTPAEQGCFFVALVDCYQGGAFHRQGELWKGSGNPNPKYFSKKTPSSEDSAAFKPLWLRKEDKLAKLKKSI